MDNTGSPFRAARSERFDARTALALLERQYAASTDAAERVVLAEEIENAETRLATAEAEFDHQIKESQLP